ncbi:MAG: Rrf2 family transcriptional regulator [Bacteroidetes bacterium]|jgi:Rrf2 family protein|nr:Rrf2 family transcriptional regulator [Bacteroidota bacterium]MBT6686254.1 Rrf2 family transcriptional regulator [Bacteroidota bacterium]MBT7145026.1 Rrf2 family transcriptional regulator [Bacteroidota bacterium]MBT7493477.1 Rrf2 family transcriptional regulator [Bacteroidota bacterium]
MSRIINISEAASIALHGIILIAKSNKMINAIQIAEKTGTSKHHVSKVMYRLAKVGYIESMRGPNGGFLLKRDPDELTLLNIFEAIEGKIEKKRCPHNQEVCSFKECIFENVTNEITIKFYNYLKNRTISKYLED